MRKLLVLVLLAVVACSTLEDDLAEYKPIFDDVSLEGIDLSVLIKIWNNVKDCFQKAVDFLKENGLYEPLVNYIRTDGREYALKFCTNKITSKEVCTGIIDWVLSHL